MMFELKIRRTNDDREHTKPFPIVGRDAVTWSANELRDIFADVAAAINGAYRVRAEQTDAGTLLVVTTALGEGVLGPIPGVVQTSLERALAPPPPEELPRGRRVAGPPVTRVPLDDDGQRLGTHVVGRIIVDD